jgi:hypothetical protein
MTNQNLINNGYVHLPGFLQRSQAISLAREYERFAKEHNLTGDDQAPNSSSCYNYVSFAELLCERTPEVSRILGERVFPTYTYGRVYRKGDDLKPHVDRDACEISLTINLYQEKPWPIHIRKPNGETASLILGPGDAMMYLGCTAEHWRDELQEEKCIQIFLHYVRSRGPRAKCIFDSRDDGKRPPLYSVDTLRELSANKYPQSLSKYILYIPDFFKKDLADEVLAEYACCDEWMQTRIGGGGGFEDIKTRGAKTIRLSIPEVIGINPNVRRVIDARLFEAASNAIQEYSKMFPECAIVKDSGYELLRYDEGMGYKQHVDNFLEYPRAVSCSFGINDDYEGGEFTFFDQALSFKQKKGSVLLFPSSFQYPHQVNPVIKGTRYSIITWFS